ncbi:copper chaperone PCu(A)C [Stutzerimonas azotifigens]|uniref:copper chaperone PCu(A)C n=1 Tax=Stutzerimonas azotifigens TaxID=291995 RepID=UPI0003FFA262|nr:copper chaperone PCu(A)C [Stutzerimonas azotifigens]
MKLPALMTLTAALLTAPLAALAHDDHPHASLRVENAWARATPPGLPNGAAYFTLHNEGAEDDRLVGAETPVADKAEVHEHAQVDGLMKMRQVGSVVVPAGGEVAFAPMGYHVMLFGLKQPLKDGERFPLTLRFEHAGEIELEVPVTAQAPAPAAHGAGHHAH